MGLTINVCCASPRLFSWNLLLAQVIWQDEVRKMYDENVIYFGHFVVSETYVVAQLFTVAAYKKKLDGEKSETSS